MDKADRDIDKIKYLIGRLRAITLTVQVAPFVYTILYIFVIFAYPFLDEKYLNIIDTLLYVSPLIVIITLIESNILRLCKWHKTACALPLIPQIFVFIDYHITQLTEVEAYVHYGSILTMSILLLISAYKVFFSNGR